jgi:ribosome-associated translation inhibitor RaiA
MKVGAPEVVIMTRGVIPDTAVDYAVGKVQRAIELAPAPVLHARVELHQHLNPSVACPFLATANIDVNGQPVRAQATAATPMEAIDLLEARLRRRLEVLSSQLNRRQRRGAATEAGQWRHGDLPSDRQPFHPRPVEAAEIVARQTYDDEPLAVEEAVYELHLLDYDFLLFVDSADGVDCLLYHPHDGGFVRICRAWTEGQQGQAEPELPPTDPNLAPDLTVTEARERLDADGERFVYFRDRATRRGSVLYHRVDGQLGLLTPAA